MAINPYVSYPTQITAPSASYPYGGPQNITTSYDGTGTPWDEDLIGDIFGFQQAVLSEADITPSGSPETAVTSQYLQGLKVIAEILQIPASDLEAFGKKRQVTVTSNSVGIGAGLYLNADGTYYESDATSSATAPCSAIALETGTGTKWVLTTGYIRNDTWAWTVGSRLFLTATPGVFSHTAPSASGNQIQVVGIAETATIIHFKPSYDMITYTP
jgi:hypothetical protein